MKPAFIRNHFPIFILFIFFFGIFTYRSIFRHLTYHSHAFDLGIYTQITYLLSQGQAAQSSLKHMNFFGDHFGVILFFISPIYRIFPFPETLLIIQSLLVTISGVFIYLICINKTQDKFQSSIITFAYLSFSGILSAINFDFHLATISVFPLSLMLYSWFFKKWKIYWLALSVGILFKEDVPIFIVGLGLYSLFKKQKAIGLFTILFGLLGFYIIKYQIMPLLHPDAANSYINTVTKSLNDPLLFINNLFDSTIKIKTTITLYGQFLMLPILSSLSLFTVLPYLLIRFSSDQPHYWGTYFHYNANIAPFLAVSTILVLKKIKLPKYLLNTLLIITIIVSNIYLNNLIISTLQFNPSEIKNYAYINNALTKIPNKASISVQSPLVPHLSNREKVYLYPEILDAEYVILDKSLNYYPLNDVDFKVLLSRLETSPEWNLYHEENDLLIFKKN